MNKIICFLLVLSFSKTLFAQEETKEKVISAEEYRLTDKDGRICGTISVLPDGTIGIARLRDFRLIPEQPIPFKKESISQGMQSSKLPLGVGDSVLGFRTGIMEMGKFESGNFFEAYLNIPIDENWFAQARFGHTQTTLDEAHELNIGDLQSTYLTLGGGYQFSLYQEATSNSKPNLVLRPSVFGIFQHNDFKIDGAIQGLVAEQLGFAGYEESLESSIGFGFGTELAFQAGDHLEATIALYQTFMKGETELSTFDTLTNTVISGFDGPNEDLGGWSLGFSIGVKF